MSNSKYKVPSYLQDKRVKDILDISSRIQKQSKPISSFKAMDDDFNEKTYNIYGTQEVLLPSITKNTNSSSDWRSYAYKNQPTQNKTSDWRSYVYGADKASEITKQREKDRVQLQSSYDKLKLPSIGGSDTNTYPLTPSLSREFIADTIAIKDKWNLNNAASSSDDKRKAYIDKYFNDQEEFKKLYLTEEPKKETPMLDKIRNLAPVKFLDRLSTEMADTATFKTGLSNNVEKKDTGSKAANTVADMLGMGLGMGVAPSGVASANKIISPASNFAEKLVPQLKNPVLNKLAPAMAKGATEFGVMSGIESYARGDNATDTFKNVSKSALGGAAFGGVTKGIGMALPKIKNSVIKTDNYESIMPLEQQNKLLGIKDNKVLSMPEIPRRYKAKVALPKVIDKTTTTSLLPDIKDVKPKSQIVSSSTDKSSLKDSLNKLYTRVVDVNDPIKKVGDETFTLATNSKNVGGTVDFIFKEGLVDRNGRKIGSSLKEIADDIPKGQEKEFWEYLLQRHNISRAAEGKPIYSDFTPQMSADKAKYFEKINPTWKEKANNITKFIDDFMNEWGVNSSITDKDMYAQLRQKYPNYIPTNRDFSSLEQGSLLTNGRGFINQGNPIKKATGSDRNITDPIENIMNLVNRTVRTARYNEVGQSMVNTVRSNPEKYRSLAEIIPDTVKVDSNVKNIVTVLENGRPINIQVNDKSLLESLQKINQSNVGDIEKAFKKATGVFKSLITQKNPVFAVRNIARDVPTAYINGSENNPIKYGLDLVRAGKDLATNSPIAQQYKGLGGGGSNFFSSEDVAKSAKELTKTPLLKRIGDGIEKFNNLTESAPRLAEFKRVADKTGNLQKALFAANDVSTNFSRGGDITKHIDSFTPYLNASVQGLDKLARQFKDKPIATVLKGATAITAPTLVLNHINKDNPNYQQLDDRTKDNYFLIPKEDGTFFKLPKSRELGVLFGSLTERILRQSQGDEEAFKNFNTTVKTNFGPANPAENNILAPLLINLPKNKDFANRTIVPQSMQDRSPQYQYDEATSEIGKKLGEVAKLSPKQIDYVIKSYTGVIGQLLLPATTKNNKGGAAKAITTQFTADPLYSNQVLTDFYDNYDKYKNLAADKNFIENIDSKVLTKEENIRNYLAKASKEISALSKQSRAAERARDMEKVRELRQKMLDIASKANSTIK